MNENDLSEIESDMVANGVNSPGNVQSATELLGILDYFYFVIGRFPTTNEHMFVPRARSPPEVNGQELNSVKLYGKFAKTNLRGIVSSQFLAALFLFFNGGDLDGKVCEFL